MKLFRTQIHMDILNKLIENVQHQAPQLASHYVPIMFISLFCHYSKFKPFMRWVMSANNELSSFTQTQEILPYRHWLFVTHNLYVRTCLLQFNASQIKQWNGTTCWGFFLSFFLWFETRNGKGTYFKEQQIMQKKHEKIVLNK